MEAEALLSSQIKNEYYFWLFGLVNNITFILLITASVDILPKNIGVIGACAIAPVFIVKVITPFIIKYKICSYDNRVKTLTLLYFLAYILICFSNELSFILIGIILSGIASGIGEITFVPIASMISERCISYWSSGSGFAGVIGSGYYLIMTQLFYLKSHITILFLIWLPFSMIIFYKKLNFNQENIEYLNYKNLKKEELKLWTVSYILPLFIVYFCEYSINLTTYLELINFNGKIFNKDEVYKKYCFTYQSGVLISRSLKLVFTNFKINFIWIFPILQGINLILFSLFSSYKIIPNISVIYLLILYEGLLGGMAYLLTFSKIKSKLTDDKRELCTSITTLGEVLGQIFATMYSIFIYKKLNL